MAFKRPSIEMATEWNKHKDEYLKIKTSDDSNGDSSQVQGAYWGMAAAAALGAIYIYKKVQRR